MNYKNYKSSRGLIKKMDSDIRQNDVLTNDIFTIDCHAINLLIV